MEFLAHTIWFFCWTNSCKLGGEGRVTRKQTMWKAKPAARSPCDSARGAGREPVALVTRPVHPGVAASVAVLLRRMMVTYIPTHWTQTGAQFSAGCWNSDLLFTHFLKMETFLPLPAPTPKGVSWLGKSLLPMRMCDIFQGLFGQSRNHWSWVMF